MEAQLRNIAKPSRFIREVYIDDENQKFNNLSTYYHTFHQQIVVLFKKWFPRAKKYSNVELAHQLFRIDLDEKDYRMWYKYSIFCMLQICESCFKSVEDFRKNDKPDLLKGEMFLLSEISFEAVILMQNAIRFLEKHDLESIHGRRFFADAREIYDASTQILRKSIFKKSDGEFMLNSASILLIRQSIELWLQELLRIDFIEDENGIYIKLQPELLFQIVSEGKESIKLPIPISVVKKIHAWCQPYVHAGYRKYVWEIELANNLLNSLFSYDKVTIKQEYLNEVEKKLMRLLKKPGLKLYQTNKGIGMIS